MQSRYYDPAVRRFLNADSYGSTGQGLLGYNMFAYCGNNPVNCSDPSGCFWEWIPLVVIPLLFSGCSSRNSDERTEKERSELRAAMNLEDLQSDSRINNYNYCCYGFTIGKVTTAVPSGYNTGDDAETAFACVQKDLGENNCKRLAGIDAPVESGWYRAAVRCSERDVHFLKQISNVWYSKSGPLPAFAVTRNEVLADTWNIILSDSVNPWERYDRNEQYTGQIIFFAIREGWSK